MSIRNAAKAIVIHGGKVLLNQCCDCDGTVYFTLPGGGQNQYETMEEAVSRECMEETGYPVEPLRFVALYEEIVDNLEARKEGPDYTHRIYHVFLCRLLQEPVKTPTEKDAMQIGCRWVDMEGVQGLTLYPLKIRECLCELVKGEAPRYLGVDRIV